MSTLQIMSFNIRGAGNFSKRRKLFHYLHKKQTDVILLQETHSETEVERIWNAEWGEKMLFSHGSANSKGVAILFKRKLKVEVVNHIADPEGRYIIANLKIKGNHNTIVNVCGPYTDQPSFWCTLFDHISENSCENVIIGGDYNTVLNPTIDWSSRGTDAISKSAVQILECAELFDYIDVWREKNPDTQMYTWVRYNPSPVFSRLDYF